MAPLGAGVTQDFVSVEALRGVSLDAVSAPPGLYVGGDFGSIGPIKAAGLARWQHGQWVTVAGWSPDPAFGVRIDELLQYPPATPTSPAGRLHAAGVFTLPGTPATRNLTRWDVPTWAPLGGQLAPYPLSGMAVYALAAYDDDGLGPRPSGLYACGNFKYAGGIEVHNIARWDGQAWEALPGPAATGISGTPVMSLGVFDDDGPGPRREALFAGGYYSHAGGVYVSGLARWDGSRWSALGGWIGGGVEAMAVFDDDGPGPNKPALFVGGGISQVAGMPASAIAKWDGEQWSTLAGGVTGFPGFSLAEAMAVYDEDGPGPNPGGLYVGGLFFFAGGAPAKGLARSGCTPPPACSANCNKDFHPVTGQPILNVFDFGCFQSRYVLQDPYADCNQDAAFTVADFGCFQSMFVAGCP